MKLSAKTCKGCRRLFTPGRGDYLCEDCKAGTNAMHGVSKKDVGGDAWRHTTEFKRKRKVFVETNPWCAMCKKLCNPPHLDHIVPHRGDVRLFWLVSNWQTLCDVCHGKKTSNDNR